MSEVADTLSTAAVACNLIVLFLCRPEEIIVLLVAAFWRSDSVGNSTLLLHHLRQIQHNKRVVQAASASVCQLIAEACSHGKQPVISLQCLLSEVSALLFDLAGPAAHTHVQHSAASCCIASDSLYNTILHWIVLYCRAPHKDTFLLLRHTSCYLVACS